MAPPPKVEEAPLGPGYIQQTAGNIEYYKTKFWEYQMVRTRCRPGARCCGVRMSVVARAHADTGGRTICASPPSPPPVPPPALRTLVSESVVRRACSQSTTKGELIPLEKSIKEVLDYSAKQQVNDPMLNGMHENVGKFSVKAAGGGCVIS